MGHIETASPGRLCRGPYGLHATLDSLFEGTKPMVAEPLIFFDHVHATESELMGECGDRFRRKAQRFQYRTDKRAVGDPRQIAKPCDAVSGTGPDIRKLIRDMQLLNANASGEAGGPENRMESIRKAVAEELNWKADERCRMVVTMVNKLFNCPDQSLRDVALFQQFPGRFDSLVNAQTVGDGPCEGLCATQAVFDGRSLAA